jgi:hypothetical protein
MSSDSEYEHKIDEEAANLERHNRGVRRRNLIILALAVAALLFALVVGFLAMENHRLAVANAAYGVAQAQEKKEIAQDLTDAFDCKAVNGKSDAVTQACKRAETAAAEPPVGPQGVQGIQGVQGPPGRDGVDGRDGAPGPSGPPGPAGKDGAAGADSTVPGPAGQNGVDGAPGADSTVPGPAGPPGPQGEPGAAGADSTVPGPAGVQGPQGEPGRGIASAYCGDDGRWLITYTDGTTQDGGQCRTKVGGIL